MKTAIYIEDGIVQLVLTPESEFEKNAVSSFQEKPTNTQIFSGSFYDCRGGWTRQTEFYRASGFGHGSEDKSLIMRIGTDASAASPVPCAGCKLLVERRCGAEQQYPDFSCRTPA